MANVYVIQAYHKDSTELVGIEGIYGNRKTAENKINNFFNPLFGDRYDFTIVEWGVI